MRIAGVPKGVTDVPVVIFAFDRPEYLATLCLGLLAQTQVRVDPARVHLMQDGAVSARTGRRQALPANIARSVAVFREHFPQGEVHQSLHNLGIGENVLRGEVLAFETLDAPVAYFFEDDLEPGPLYLAALEAMRVATEPFAEQVGPFAPYGSVGEAAPGPGVEYRELGHHWGYGLRRGPWRRIQAQLQDYWEEIRRNDFRARNRRRVLELWRRREVASDATSQDAAVALACVELGLARLGTDVCFGRYIGVDGEHFNREIFRRLGFEGMRWAEAEEFVFRPLSGERVAAIGAEDHRARAEWRRSELDPMIAALEAERDDPDRLVTAAEVAALWYLLLDRRKVPPAVTARHAGRTRLRDLRREIVRMREFQRMSGP